MILIYSMINTKDNSIIVKSACMCMCVYWCVSVHHYIAVLALNVRNIHACVCVSQAVKYYQWFFCFCWYCAVYAIMVVFSFGLCKSWPQPNHVPFAQFRTIISHHDMYTLNWQLYFAVIWEILLFVNLWTLWSV